MKIQSVTLVNFRNHTNSTFSFDNGVNLLIGHNGAGKSSILEAIGFALFGAELRSKGTQKSAVQYGSKSATIEIRFIGIDENEYRVERKIGSTSQWRLFVGEESSYRVQGEDVGIELRKLTGVSKNEKRIFSDVICAVQNRFTDIFNQTETNRELTFNLLFETDIYRTIYGKFTDENSVIRSYSSQKNQLEGKSELLTESRINRDEVIGQKKECELNIEKVTIQRNTVQKEIDSQNESLKVLNNQIHTFDTNQKEHTSITNELVTLTGSLKKSKLNIEEAKISVQMVSDNEESFNRYSELQAERVSKEVLIKDEQTLRESLKSAKDQLQLNLDRINTQNNRIAVIDSESKTISEKKTVLFSECEKLSKENDSIGKELSDIEMKGKTLRPLSVSYEELFKSLSTNDDEKKELLIKIESHRVDGKQVTELVEEIKTLNSDIEKYDKEVLILRGLQDDESKRNHRIEELNQAKEKLSTGLCPILQEQCKNTEVTSGSDSYFDNREVELQNELAEIQVKTDRLKNIPNLLDLAKQNRSVKENELHRINEGKIAIDHLSEKLLLKGDKNSILREKLSLVEPSVECENYELRKVDIDQEIMILLERYTQRKNKRDEISLDLQRKTKENIDSDTKLKSLDSEKMNLVKSNDEIGVSNSLYLTKIEETDFKVKQLDGIRVEINLISEQMNHCEEGYKAVLSNREKAGKLSEFQSDRDHHISKISERTVRKSELEISLKDIDVQSLQTKAELMEVELKEKRTQKEVVNDSLTTTKNQLKVLNDQLEKEEQQRQQFDSLVKDLAVIERKLELTDLFRKNIKDMGRLVASKLVEEIAHSATDYFRQITGSGEEIQWLVSESEKYTVYLVTHRDGEELRREFSVLSGGEQVAVALSLRTAMAQELAGGDFAIFDEPTVNLDSERKVALAESIKSMLGTLNQTIIVTHDDVFREMAQNIIEV